MRHDVEGGKETLLTLVAPDPMEHQATLHGGSVERQDLDGSQSDLVRAKLLQSARHELFP